MSNKQLLKSKSGLRMVSTSDADRSPFLLEEPHWEDDALVRNQDEKSHHFCAHIVFVKTISSFHYTTLRLLFSLHSFQTASNVTSSLTLLIEG